VTDSPEEQARDEDPLLDWEAARYLFWFALVMGVSLAAFEVAVEGVSGFGIGTLAAFQGAFGILVQSGRLKNWKLAQRIASALFALAWIAFLIPYGQVRGWF
jgi:hypothetical protein